MKRGHEHGLGLGVDLLRRADLLELATAHHRDTRSHGHRLDLIVGDVEDRRVEPAVQVDELGAGLAAQLGVEVRQRLVHAEHRRLAHDRPGQRNTLALAAAELAGLAIEVLGEPERVRRRPWPWRRDRPSTRRGP